MDEDQKDLDKLANGRYQLNRVIGTGRCGCGNQPPKTIERNV